MLGRRRDPGVQDPSHEERGREPGDRVRRREVAVARGGVSLLGVLTGVVVTFGALFLLSALVGGIFAATGVDEGGLGRRTTVGLGVGIGMAVAWFLACLWGGYTAGRMGRGAGVLNGALVVVASLVLGFVVAGIVGALGATATLNLPFTSNVLPTDDATIYELSVGFGIGILVCMFLGGVVGGAFGSRWHTKLERATIREEEERAARERAFVAPRRDAGDRERDERDAGRREVDLRDEDSRREAERDDGRGARPRRG